MDPFKGSPIDLFKGTLNPKAESQVNPNILSTTGLKFEGLVFATAGSSCIAILGR